MLDQREGRPARHAWRSATRSRFPATRSSINSATLPGSTRSMQPAMRWVSANRPGLKSPANRPASCPGRTGCGSSTLTKSGLPPTRRTSLSARATISRRRCRWRMAYSTVANGGISYYPRLVDRVLNQDGSPVLDADGKIAVPHDAQSARRFPERSYSGADRDRQARLLESGQRRRRHRAASRGWKTCRSRARPAPRRRC